MPRGHFNLDDYEGDYDSYHCFAAEQDEKQADTYDEVMTSRYNADWMRL